MQKEYVRGLFDAIAYRYDLLNHLLSGGIDLYWRRVAVETLMPFFPQRILDVATGTADLAIAALRLHPREVVGVDISEAMLAVARKKIVERKIESIIRVEKGEAEHLQFGDCSFDAAIVAFGVRNFEDLDKGLSEMFRVLKSGGRIVVLEFSRPVMFPFRQLYFFYFRTLLPVIGAKISRHNEAYRYLPETVMQFPDGGDFLQHMKEAGFLHVNQKRMTFGIATVYTGEK
jgi:demethylmenaquinone methyltransferase / 2-methoxy-6-polyprenyl-1,4-benzoquinol methylase